MTLLFLEPRVTDSSFSLNAFEVLPVQGRGDINCPEYVFREPAQNVIP